MLAMCECIILHSGRLSRSDPRLHAARHRLLDEDRVHQQGHRRGHRGGRQHEGLRLPAGIAAAVLHVLRRRAVREQNTGRAGNYTGNGSYGSKCGNF